VTERAEGSLDDRGPLELALEACHEPFEREARALEEHFAHGVLATLRESLAPLEEALNHVRALAPPPATESDGEAKLPVPVPVPVPRSLRGRTRAAAAPCPAARSKRI